MELSEAQKHLIVGLRLLNVEKDAIPGIVMTLEMPEQQDALMEWMCEHPKATTQEVLKETARIVGT